MRKISESRKEFNRTMHPYTAIVIQKEHKPFSDDFFIQNELVIPRERIFYVPPPWVGVKYSPHVIATFRWTGKSPEISRVEKIPEANSLEKYLACDEYAHSGETFEILMIRLMEQGVKLENIWCITQGGCAETNFPTLDKGINWYQYCIRQRGLIRITLEDLGFNFPAWP